MNEREQLEQQLRDLEAQKVTLFDSGSADPVEVGRINEKIKATQQQLNAIERDEVIEEKIHADEIPFAVSGVDMVGMPVEVIQFVEEVVKTDRKRIYNEHAIELEQMEQVRAEEIKAAHAQIDEMMESSKREFEEINQVLFEIRGQQNDISSSLKAAKELCSQLELEKADAIKKRDAAVTARETAEEALRQANEEIKELHAKIAEYEQANAYAERQEQPLTTTPEESTSLQEKADAIKKLFVSRENWGSVDKLTLPDGSYKVVKRSEVEDNWEEATVPEIAQESTEEAVEVPEQSFREEDTEDTGCTLDRDEIVSESVEDTSGGETFEERTERRLALLEAHAFGEVKAVA